jgi:hypothetical protein
VSAVCIGHEAGGFEEPAMAGWLGGSPASKVDVDAEDEPMFQRMIRR